MPAAGAVRLLAIDTCFGACSAALAVDGVVRAGCYEARRTGHAEALLPMVERVLAEAGVSASSLNRIAVTRGPGTFAGVRIGLAAAEGLRLSTGAGLVAVSSLWAIGQRVIAGHGPLDRALAIAVDAGRDQVYLECLDACGAAGEGPKLVAVGSAVERLAGMNAALAGSAARRLAIGAGARVLAEAVEPRAADFAVAAGRQPVVSGVVAPLYLRTAEFVAQAPPQGIRA
jgi:tRNA threonylcarbamoyladenosine biosynthesis protein TsaB